MNQWQRNHFKLLRLVEWREQSLSDSVERLLIRVGREYRKKDYAPSALELVQAMEPVMPFIRNLVASAGITGTAEAVIRANFDLKTPFREYFRHGSLPTRITLDKIWEYLEATGFERGPLFEQMQAHTRRMTDQIARLAEKKIHETLTEGMAQKWTLDRMKGQLTREFNGLKKQDVESVMPSVETVVRTESMTILHASQWESAQCTPALRSMLWGFEYFAVGDARTRPTHDAQDGVTAPATSDFWNHWYPPNGYNCRCSVIPLYDEPEPSERKEPRWDLNPDKGFDFNPGRSRPFNLGTPKAQEPEKPQQTESPKPSKPSRESDRISIPAEPLRVPELSKLDTPPLSQFSTLPKANPLESVTKKPESVAKPSEIVTKKPESVAKPSEIVTKKPESVAKPSKKESGSPFRPMTQDEMVSVLLTVRSRFGVETAKRLTLVPSPGGCEVFWDGVFVGSVGFELDVSGLQLTLSPVRFFKIIFGKVKKTFYSLWSVVEWVVEQKTDEEVHSPFPGIEHRVKTEKYHGDYFQLPKNITPELKKDMKKQRRDENEKPIVYYLLNSGHDVQLVPEDNSGKMYDSFVDGVRTEFKTINGESLKTAKRRIIEAYSQNASWVIIDERKNEISKETAIEIVEMAIKTFGGILKIDVEIWSVETGGNTKKLVKFIFRRKNNG